MENNPYSYLERHRLLLSLYKVPVERLIFLTSTSEPVYIYLSSSFFEVLKSNSKITLETVKDIFQQSNGSIYLHKKDYEKLLENMQSGLVKLARSMSMGSPLTNGKRNADALTMNLELLYKDPYSEKLLNTQIQSIKNFSTFLFSNKNIQNELYRHVEKSRANYIHSHPLLSSILLLSFFQEEKLFHEKEIQSLFIANYFKDIGLSFLPSEVLEKKVLTQDDKNLISIHAETSLDILKGRMQLTRNHMLLIKNHHYFNRIVKQKLGEELPDETTQLVVGVETILLNAIDVIVAMTHKRPYREALTLFQALDFVKKVMPDEFSQEFKSLVQFINKFLSK